jgi:hypothetical protein
VRIRSRKPCVFARRRLFGWKVRLLTSDSIVRLFDTSRTWPPGRGLQRARRSRSRTAGCAGSSAQSQQRYRIGRVGRQIALSRRVGAKPATLRRTRCNAPTTRRFLLSTSGSAVRFPHRVTPRRDPGPQPQRGGLGASPYTDCGQLCGSSDLKTSHEKVKGSTRANRPWG